MRGFLLTAALATGLAATVAVSTADAQERRITGAAIGGGIGAVVAGPPGAIVGGAVGAYVGGPKVTRKYHCHRNSHGKRYCH